MADTADRRSEGKVADTPEKVYSRKQYVKAQLSGKCVMCHHADVKNRSYCYSCSTKQSSRTYRSGLRSYFTQLGIDWKDESAKITVTQAEALLELARSNG